ncbi:MAG: hypothetical protein ACO2OO_01005 [Candidatus Aenigmatarchaeota archaeon]
MATTIIYPSSQTIIRGNNLSPVVANAVLLDLSPSTSSPAFDENVRLAYLDALRSNSQGTLGFNLAYGSLTQIVLKISFYRNNQAYQQTASTFQGGEQILKPMTLVLNNTDLPNGRYQYEFPIPPCDGIRIEVASISGTNTGSSITEFHLALRIN